MTAGGTGYEQIRLTLDAVSGQEGILLVPYGARAAATSDLVLVAHGAGQDAAMVLGSDWDTTRDAMLDAGYLVCAHDADSAAWGTTSSQDAYVEMVQWVSSYLPVNRLAIVGQSMGCQAGLLLAANDRFSNLAGVAGIAGVCDLAAAYAVDVTFTNQIDTAYSIGDYATATSGHDPILRDSADYTGLRLRWYASDADPLVPKADHADAMAAHVASVATEYGVVEVTGGHVSSDHYQVADLSSFLSRCFP